MSLDSALLLRKGLREIKRGLDWKELRRGSAITNDIWNELDVQDVGSADILDDNAIHGPPRALFNRAEKGGAVNAE